jgi:hypothetical protein
MKTAKIRKKPPPLQINEKKGARIRKNPKHPSQPAASPNLHKPARTTKLTTTDRQKQSHEDHPCKFCIFKLFRGPFYHTSRLCKALMTAVGRYHEDIITILEFALFLTDHLSRRPIV